MTWEELLRSASNRLSQAGVPDPELDAWYLMEAAYGLCYSNHQKEAFDYLAAHPENPA